MIDPLSATASVITIVDAVKKVVDGGRKIKNAPTLWLQCCNELDIVSHLNAILEDILNKPSAKRVRELEIPSSKGDKSLVGFVNKQLISIREEAKEVLDKMPLLQQERNGRLERLFGWIAKTGTSVQFFLRENEIQNLCQAVNHAKSSLQLAVCIAQLHLATTDPSRQELTASLQDIKETMVKRSDALEALHKTRQPDSGPKYMRHKHPKRNARLKRPTSRVLQNSGTSSNATQPDEMQSPHSQFLGVADIPTHGDRDGSGIQSSSTNLPQLNNPDTMDDEAGVIIMPISTDDDTFSTFRGGESTVFGEPREDPVSELNDSAVLGSSPLTTTVSEGIQTEVTEARLLALQVEGRPKVLIAEGLGQVDGMSLDSERMLFCVAGITVAEGEQDFLLRKSCSADEGCRHVIIDCLILYKMSAKMSDVSSLSIAGGVEYGRLDNATFIKTSPPLLHLIEQCENSERCNHTSIEGDGSFPTSCCVPVTLRASIDPFSFDSSATHTYAGFPSRSFIGNLPCHPEPGDDTLVFELAKNVLGNSLANIPETVDKETLVKFLSLADKYQLGKAHLEQAKRWADRLRPQIPTSFDRESYLWLWISWRLEMKQEFKAFSGLAQQHAEWPLDELLFYQWDSDLLLRYGSLILPDWLTDQINEKRSSSLMQIESIMDFCLDSLRQLYDKESNMMADETIRMRICLYYGYFALEKQRWLSPDDRLYKGSKFGGVSVSNICTGLRSMIDLREWMAVQTGDVDGWNHEASWVLYGRDHLLETIDALESEKDLGIDL